MTVVNLADHRTRRAGGWRDFRDAAPPENRPFRMKLPLGDQPCSLLYKRRGAQVYAKSIGDRAYIRCAGVSSHAKWRPL